MKAQASVVRAPTPTAFPMARAGEAEHDIGGKAGGAQPQASTARLGQPIMRWVRRSSTTSAIGT